MRYFLFCQENFAFLENFGDYSFSEKSNIPVAFQNTAPSPSAPQNTTGNQNLWFPISFADLLFTYYNSQSFQSLALRKRRLPGRRRYPAVQTAPVRKLPIQSRRTGCGWPLP